MCKSAEPEAAQAEQGRADGDESSPKNRVEQPFVGSLMKCLSRSRLAVGFIVLRYILKTTGLSAFPNG